MLEMFSNARGIVEIFEKAFTTLFSGKITNSFVDLSFHDRGTLKFMSGGFA